jgi:hypothetical protein
MGAQWPAASSQQLAAILRLTIKAVYRDPLTVYRLSHLMSNKVFTHGKWVTQLRLAAKWALNSQQPEANS